MMTSKDPGTLGFYGFRNRKDHTYDGLAFATSEKMKRRSGVGHPVGGRKGRASPCQCRRPTPPAGQRSDRLLPHALRPTREYTYPEELKDEIQEMVGDYMVDIRDFRTDDRKRVVRDVNTMTERRFKIARFLL